LILFAGKGRQRFLRFVNSMAVSVISTGELRTGRGSKENP
jgi:hypothetical protein